MRYLLIVAVKIYQISLGPLLRLLNGGHGLCRHQPTCSQYAIDALNRHGAFYGSWLTIRRLLRCHPWGTAGYDPVPPKTEKKRSSSAHEN